MAKRSKETERRDDAVAVLTGHTNAVRDVAVSRDGRRAVSGSYDYTVRVWDLEANKCLGVLQGHDTIVRGVALSEDGRRVVSGSYDHTVRVRNLEGKSLPQELRAHSKGVNGVAVSWDGRLAVSGSDDKTVRVWNLEAAEYLGRLDGHTHTVLRVAVSGDGRWAVSGSTDETVRVWDLEGKRRLGVLKGHTRAVRGVAMSGDGRLAVSGSMDRTVRVWDVEARQCLGVLEGHTGEVNGVAVSEDGRRAVSASSDKTVRVWDLEAMTCLGVLEGHMEAVWGVAVSGNGGRAVSGSDDDTVRVWDLTKLPELVNVEQARVYTNAKVLLVGDSGVGKTGLAIRMTTGEFRATISTDGAWATQMLLPETEARGGSPGLLPSRVDREIWLWDFGGQSDYRLIHQLFMEGTAVAVLVFDPQRESAFDGLGECDRELERVAKGEVSKLLVAGRCDRGGLWLAERVWTSFAESEGLQGFWRQVRKQGWGVRNYGRGLRGVLTGKGFHGRARQRYLRI